MCTANVMRRKLVDYSRPPLESLRRNDPARRPRPPDQRWADQTVSGGEAGKNIPAFRTGR